MDNRKFTPPTEFPAEYVDGNGERVVLLGRSPAKFYPLIGYGHRGRPNCWTEEGLFVSGAPSVNDLHDIPKRIATWHNVYPNGLVGCYPTPKGVKVTGGVNRLCVYRIERDEDGGNPEIFVEKVEDFKEEV